MLTKLKGYWEADSVVYIDLNEIVYIAKERNYTILILRGSSSSIRVYDTPEEILTIISHINNREAY